MVSDARVVDQGITPEAAPPRRRSRASMFALVLAALSLVLVAPATTSMWSTVRHWHETTTGGAADIGQVTVTHCSRRPLLVSWSCRGTFRVDDPMGQPGGPVRNVSVPNDFQHHPFGGQVPVTLVRHDRTAYLWGDGHDAEVLAGTIGVLLCLSGIVGIIAARRRRVEWFTTAIALLGVVLVLPIILHVVGLRSSQSLDDEGPTPPPPSTAPGR